MQRVYEKFILNFYALNLDRSIYRVYAPKFTWLKSTEMDLWEDVEEADTHMPELRTDIVIENKRTGVQFIIDAKYYREALVSSHRGEAKKFRREHISQIFTYMANSTFQGTKRGALMYPTVVDVIDEKQNIVSGWVFFKSLNLDSEWRDIHNQLLSFVQKAD